jgi:hypothetical protein
LRRAVKLSPEFARRASTWGACSPSRASRGRAARAQARSVGHEEPGPCSTTVSSSWAVPRPALGQIPAAREAFEAGRHAEARAAQSPP